MVDKRLLDEEADFLVEMSQKITLKDEERKRILRELEDGAYLDAYMEGEEEIAREAITPEFAFLCDLVDIILIRREEEEEC
jgi:hypothetical protein